MPPGARFSPDEDAAPAPLPPVSLSGFYERAFPMTRDGVGGQKFGRVRAGTSREKFFVFWFILAFVGVIPYFFRIMQSIFWIRGKNG